MKASNVTFVTLGLLGVIVLMASFHSTSGAANDTRSPASQEEASVETPASAPLTDKHKPPKTNKNSLKNQKLLTR